MGNMNLRDLQVIEKVLDMTCDTMFLVNRENICVDVIMKTDNPIFNPRVNLIGKNIISVLPESIRLQVEKALDHSRKTGETYNANYDLPTDEKMYYFKLIVNQFDEEHLICQYRDITQRSNMKNRLRSALTALIEVGKVAMIGLWSFDCSKEEFVLTGYSNIAGRNLEEPLQISLEVFLRSVHPDDHRPLCDYLFKEGNEYSRFEFRVVDSKGVMQNMQSTKYRSYLEKDSLIIDGFSQNITDLIKNRSELEMLMKVVEQAPYSIHANKLNGELVFVNQECRLQNQIPDDLDLSKCKIFDTLHFHGSEEEWHQHIKEIQQTNGFLRYRSTHAYPQRDIIGSECISFIIPNGIGEDIIWTMRRDISDQLRYEEQLLKSKEAAEESERLKSLFISNMNHEIRTPLSAIIGFSDIIAETDDAELRRSYGKILSSNGVQLLRLVTDVLEMSNLGTGKMRFIPNLISLKRVLQELELSFGNLTQIAALVFEIPDEDVVVNVDRGRILQLLTNLINNAIKFTPEEGFIYIGFTQTTAGIRFYVKDTGIGIPSNKLELIFDRFVKLNDTDRGTGLGLAICKSIVEQMEGKIWVESKVDKGSTFYIELPLIPISQE